MKNKSCFSKIIYYKKYKDLVDVKSFVFGGTIFSSTVILIIYWIMKHYLSLNQVISKFVEYLDNITMSMIGFLGFIVTGLAILTGAISSKLFKSLKESKNLKR